MTEMVSRKADIGLPVRRWRRILYSILGCLPFYLSDLSAVTKSWEMVGSSFVRPTYLEDML